MERLRVSTVNECARKQATRSGSSILKSCVNSSAKTMPVNGERMVPPRIAPMLTRGQNPLPRCGRKMLSTPPRAAPIISKWRQNTAGSSRTERDHPDNRFHQKDSGKDREGHVAVKESPD